MVAGWPVAQGPGALGGGSAAAAQRPGPGLRRQCGAGRRRKGLGVGGGAGGAGARLGEKAQGLRRGRQGLKTRGNVAK